MKLLNVPVGLIKIAKKTGLRRTNLDRLIDYTRFRIDTSPYLDYQPLPWLGLHRARREAGSRSRWEAMRSVVNDLDVGSAVDVGSNVGWFALNLALCGVTVLAVERDPKFYRTLLFAGAKMRLTNVVIQVSDVNSNTIDLLPRADAVVFLAVWHHVVREHGMSTASELTQGLWQRTRTVLFFETGEVEIPAAWGLPSFEPDAKTWVSRYLMETLEDAKVIDLGEHEAFSPGNLRCKRTLWAVIWTKPLIAG